MKFQPVRCPAQHCVTVMGGKWKPIILWHLFQGPRRFSELQRGIDGITLKMLTQQLRELESQGIVHRKVFPQVPPKVEYSLTQHGQTLHPVVQAMVRWGQRQN